MADRTTRRATPWVVFAVGAMLEAGGLALLFARTENAVTVDRGRVALMLGAWTVGVAVVLGVSELAGPRFTRGRTWTAVALMGLPLLLVLPVALRLP